MKITKTASGKRTIKISKKEWMNIGKKAGWAKEAVWQNNRVGPAGEAGWELDKQKRQRERRKNKTPEEWKKGILKYPFGGGWDYAPEAVKQEIKPQMVQWWVKSVLSNPINYMEIPDDLKQEVRNNPEALKAWQNWRVQKGYDEPESAGFGTPGVTGRQPGKFGGTTIWRKMKITKTASGKQTIKISKKEWTNIGKKAGWSPYATDGEVIGDLDLNENPEVNPVDVYEDSIIELKSEIQNGYADFTDSSWAKETIEKKIMAASYDSENDLLDSNAIRAMFSNMTAWCHRMSKKYDHISTWCQHMENN